MFIAKQLRDGATEYRSRVSGHTYTLRTSMGQTRLTFPGLFGPATTIYRSRAAALGTIALCERERLDHKPS